MYSEEITQFRGAIIHAVQGENALLFHNHQDDSFRYAYPLIQYKRIQRKAAIVCVKEGTEEIGKFFANANFDIKLGQKSVRLEIESIRPQQPIIQVWDSDFSYYLRHWLPLNQENYQKYVQTESLSDKIHLLEKILIGNMLSFCKGMDIVIEKEIKCCITQLDEPEVTRFKGVPIMSFGGTFKTNLSLPDYIGLGKGASIGHGVVVRKENKG